MKGLIVLTCLFSLLCFGCGSEPERGLDPGSRPAMGPDPFLQPISAARANYFPLVPGARRSYRFRHDGVEGQETIVIQRIMIDGTAAFYGVVEAELDDQEAIIGPNLPGLGAYIIADNGIDTFPCKSKADLSPDNLKQRQSMLVTPLQVGLSTKIVDYGVKRVTTMTMAGYETITVPAGTFENSVRIDIMQTWNSGEKYTGAIWLIDGLGVVKWQRCTGRVEELVSYNLEGQ